MEVHQHTHTPRKKWTHYFWEFFMLFLAVTLGFFVENQREHMLNRSIEKKFIVSLLHDLEKDTARLNTLINIGERRSIIFDSLILLLHHPEPQSQSARIYHYGSVSFFFAIFLPNDQAYQNIKNSGSLRIFHSQDISDSIGRYYTLVQYLSYYFEVFSREVMLRYRSVANEVFNGQVLYQLDTAHQDFFSPIRPTNSSPLITSDEKTLNKLSVEVYTLYLNNYNQRLRYKELKLAGTGLLSFLKKKYHLE